jgi:adenine-specific DNA-methyltransferase
MRDRLLLCRDLLATRGSIFVQINDTNMHHIKELMDEVFGSENFSAIITYAKTTSTTGDDLSVVNDYILWYFRDHESDPKVRMLFKLKRPGEAGGTGYNKIRLADGTFKPLSEFDVLPEGARICATDNLTSSKPPGDFPVEFAGKTWRPQKGYWKTGEVGMQRLIAAERVGAGDKTLSYIRYLDDFPVFEINNLWTDTVGQNQFGPGGKIYAVQTANVAVQRCMLMTTDPGDLVFDPTCGSGTTAYVAEQWGRRWITSDVSRVPLALARQRLLTATFDWFELQDDNRGPSSGFVYKRKTNKKGQEIGGLVPHLKLDDIANNEPGKDEVLVDRPETKGSITRVTGPFCVESTIPTPSDLTETEQHGSDEGSSTFSERMLEILRKSPLLHTGDNKTLTLKSIRPPAKSLTLSAEGVAVNGDERNVAFVFGPENGSVTESLVFEAAREAYMKGYAHLFVIGFAVEAKARMFVQKCNEIVGIPATYVQATTDLTMSDLLKTMRSSQIFSVCGLPDVNLYSEKTEDGTTVHRVQLLGLDVFDPVTMLAEHYKGDDAADSNKVPAWFLDTDYNGLCFHVSQAFFPRTAAWDSLKHSLKGTYDDSVWDHLAGTISEPFEPGDHKQIAVKVIDDRGNELLVVKSLSEAAKQTAKK